MYSWVMFEESKYIFKKHNLNNNKNLGSCLLSVANCSSSSRSSGCSIALSPLLGHWHLDFHMWPGAYFTHPAAEYLEKQEYKQQRPDEYVWNKGGNVKGFQIYPSIQFFLVFCYLQVFMKTFAMLYLFMASLLDNLCSYHQQSFCLVSSYQVPPELFCRLRVSANH